MPTDWAAKAKDAITNLVLKTDRVLEPDQSLSLIDDVVAGKLAAAELATIHGVPQEAVKTTLGQVTRAAGMGGKSLEAAAGMPSKGTNTLTRWLPVSLLPGSRRAAWRDPPRRDNSLIEPTARPDR